MGLFLEADFAFSLVILLLYQWAKFRELSSLDGSLARRLRGIENLRAADFTSFDEYATALLLYLAATATMFALICSVPPDLIRGFAELNGVSLNSEMSKQPYPLYIAAAYMGLTQPGIKGLSRVSDVQREIFHQWIGVPRRVVETSDFLVNQIFAGAERGERELVSDLRLLISDPWLQKIDRFADIPFMKLHLQRLQLDKESAVSELDNSSSREIKALLEEVVLLASIATVRESGGRALEELARELRLKLPERHAPARIVALVFLISVSVLWILPPIFSNAIAQLPDFDLSMLWPQSYYATAIYLFSNLVPVFVGIYIAISAARRMHHSATELRNISLRIERYASPLIKTFLFTVVYDICLGLYEWGAWGSRGETSIYEFLLRYGPFYVLHAVVPCIACFTALELITTSDDALGKRPVGLVLFGCGATVVISFIYGFARVLDFGVERLGDTYGLDYMALFAFINAVAVALGLFAATSTRNINLRAQNF